jgi:curli biogenesis system outer membrane secretion channel CsgG
MRKIFVIFSILIGLVTQGCVGAAVQAVQYGAYALDSMENVDVKARLAPSISQGDIEKIKNVAVVLTSDEAQDSTPKNPMGLFGAADTASMKRVMADNFAMEMFDLGFNVVEREQLDAIVSEQGLSVSGLMAPGNAVKIGELLGIDAFVMGNIIAEKKIKRSFVGGSIDSVITSATMKIVDADTGTVMMVVTLSYKHGQNPQEASKIMAQALKLEFDKILKPEIVKN